MNSYIIEMESYTAARNAVRHLQSMHIRVQLQKVGSGRNGCSFGIRVSDDTDRICYELRKAGMRCGIIRKGG